LESSKKNAGWPRRKPDNKFKESIEQLEKSDRKPIKLKALYIIGQDVSPDRTKKKAAKCR